MFTSPEGTRFYAAKSGVVECVGAEAIVDGDGETAVLLLMRVGELVEANVRLEARVAELERRLNRSSRNSSLPPSRDPPSAPPRVGKPGSGRKRGAQPGHQGRHRRLFPREQVNEVVEHWPERCQACARVFAEDERADAAAVQCQQVAELPPIAVTVTEHRLHRLRCPGCAAETRAELPGGVSWSAFGPRLQAAVVTLTVRNRVSRRDTTELARELFGVELATGSVDTIVQRAGEALAGPYTRLERQIKAASVVNIDETGWKTAGGNRTLWGALTRQTAVFRIAAGRPAVRPESASASRARAKRTTHSRFRPAAASWSRSSSTRLHPSGVRAATTLAAAGASGAAAAPRRASTAERNRRLRKQSRRKDTSPPRRPPGS